MANRNGFGVCARRVGAVVTQGLTVRSEPVGAFGEMMFEQQVCDTGVMSPSGVQTL